MKIFPIIVLAVALVACSYESSDTYRASETGQKLSVEYAVVQSSREVTVTEDTDVEKNWYGPVATATVAGVGANVGGANDAIVFGAAVLGLGLGYLIEEAADTRKGHEYILRDSETGEEYAIVVSVQEYEAVASRHAGSHCRVRPSFARRAGRRLISWSPQAPPLCIRDVSYQMLWVPMSQLGHLRKSKAVVRGVGLGSESSRRSGRKSELNNS
jgi:outer membrane lipoprotein SlyB